MHNVPRYDDRDLRTFLIETFDEGRRISLSSISASAQRIDTAAAKIQQLRPGEAIPNYDTAGAEHFNGADLAAKEREGLVLAVQLERRVEQIQTETERARQAALTPAERQIEALTALVERQQTQIAALMMEQKKRTQPSPSITRSANVPQMLMPSVQRGPLTVFGAPPEGVGTGRTRCIGRVGSIESVPAMVPAGGSRKAHPGTFS